MRADPELAGFVRRFVVAGLIKARPQLLKHTAEYQEGGIAATGGDDARIARSRSGAAAADPARSGPRNDGAALAPRARAGPRTAAP